MARTMAAFYGLVRDALPDGYSVTALNTATDLDGSRYSMFSVVREHGREIIYLAMTFPRGIVARVYPCADIAGDVSALAAANQATNGQVVQTLRRAESVRASALADRIAALDDAPTDSLVYTVDLEHQSGGFDHYSTEHGYDAALVTAKRIAGLRGYDGALVNGGAYVNAPSGNVYRVSPDGGVQLWHAADGGPGPIEHVSPDAALADQIPSEHCGVCGQAFAGVGVGCACDDTPTDAAMLRASLAAASSTHDRVRSAFGHSDQEILTHAESAPADDDGYSAMFSTVVVDGIKAGPYCPACLDLTYDENAPAYPASDTGTVCAACGKTAYRAGYDAARTHFDRMCDAPAGDYGKRCQLAAWQERLAVTGADYDRGIVDGYSGQPPAGSPDCPDCGGYGWTWETHVTGEPGGYAERVGCPCADPAPLAHPRETVSDTVTDAALAELVFPAVSGGDHDLAYSIRTQAAYDLGDLGIVTVRALTYADGTYAVVVRRNGQEIGRKTTDNDVDALAAYVAQCEEQARRSAIAAKHA